MENYMNFIKNKFILLSVFSLFFSFPLLAMEEINDNFNGKYIIKNVRYDEFLFSENRHEGYARGKNSISKQSACTIEKRAEGYLIKNYEYGEYLSAEDDGRTMWRKNLTANSYFYFLKTNSNEYVIKSKKFSDYLEAYSSPIYDGSRCIHLSNTINNASYFIFHQFPESPFH